jgi:predicted metal-dependent phosphoesterase TrpH
MMKTSRRQFISHFGRWTIALLGVGIGGPFYIRQEQRKFTDDIEKFRNERAILPSLPGLTDFKGVIHAHTHISHDSTGTPDDIVRAAREAGLRFLMTTDHNSKRIFTEGLQGNYGDLLIIRGAEIIQGGQSILAINLKEYIEEWGAGPKPLQQIVNEIKSQGALVFVAHPYEFKEWDIDGIDGMELYDMADSAVALKWKIPWVAAQAATSFKDHPDEVYLSILSRPDDNLYRWDRLTRKRKWIGIAGNDAHQRFALFGRQLDPYQLVFRFVQTHILAPKCDETALLNALMAGHTYSSFGLLADAGGFQFTAGDSIARGTMGDSIPLSPRLVLTAHTPNTGTIRLYHNGKIAALETARRMDYPVKERGVYRIEVSLPINGTSYPWIISNPIYVI